MFLIPHGQWQFHGNSILIGNSILEMFTKFWIQIKDYQTCIHFKSNVVEDWFISVQLFYWFRNSIKIYKFCLKIWVFLIFWSFWHKKIGFKEAPIMLVWSINKQIELNFMLGGSDNRNIQIIEYENFNYKFFHELQSYHTE